MVTPSIIIALISLLAVSISTIISYVHSYLRSEDNQAKYEEGIQETIAARHQVELHPSDAAAHMHLGKLISPSEEARQQFTTALRLDPSLLEAYEGLANLYERSGDYRHAIGVYRDILRIQPSAWPFSAMAANHNRLKEHSKAVALYRQALSLDPNNSEYRYFLGYTYYVAGNKKEAQQQWWIVVRQGSGQDIWAERAKEELKVISQTTSNSSFK